MPAHTPAYLLSPERGVEPLAADPGLPLGVVEDFSFAPHRHRLAPGEAVVLYTDGVDRGRRRRRHVCSARRGWRRCWPTGRTASCEAVVGKVFDAVLDFSKGATQADDIAILVVRYNGVPADTGRAAAPRSAAEVA